MNRRKFLKMLGLGGAAVVTAPLLPEAPKVEDTPPAALNIDDYYQNYHGGTIGSFHLMGSAGAPYDLLEVTERYRGGSG